tara:strand:- start:169 stop:579 length:411 start_codon:yes stop_codon:yes gene_type:complete
MLGFFALFGFGIQNSQKKKFDKIFSKLISLSNEHQYMAYNIIKESLNEVMLKIESMPEFIAYPFLKKKINESKILKEKFLSQKNNDLSYLNFIGVSLLEIFFKIILSRNPKLTKYVISRTVSWMQIMDKYKNISKN